MLDIVQTTDILSQWIRICSTPEQVKFVEEVMNEFVVKRFEDKEPNIVMASAKGILLTEMDEQLTIIAHRNIR